MLGLRWFHVLVVIVMPVGDDRNRHAHKDGYEKTSLPIKNLGCGDNDGSAQHQHGIFQVSMSFSHVKSS